jgi:hypothetical protein
MEKGNNMPKVETHGLTPAALEISGVLRLCGEKITAKT